MPPLFRLGHQTVGWPAQSAVLLRRVVDRESDLQTSRPAAARYYSRKCLEPNNLSRDLTGWQIHLTSLDRAIMLSQVLIRQ